MQVETPLGSVATPTIIATKARPVIASSIPPPVAARAVPAVSFSFPSTSIAPPVVARPPIPVVPAAPPVAALAASVQALAPAPSAPPKRASKAVVVPAKRARIHSKEEQLVAHSLLGLTGPAAACPAPIARKPSHPASSPLNFSFNLVPMAR